MERMMSCIQEAETFRTTALAASPLREWEVLRMYVKTLSLFACVPSAEITRKTGCCIL